jgi:hypothetical protein
MSFRSETAEVVFDFYGRTIDRIGADARCEREEYAE